jgi:hypothetical protein
MTMKDTQARPIFKRLLEAMETYAQNVTATVAKFREDYEAAAKYASAYKDEKRILADKRTKLASKAREEITHQGAELGEVAARCARDLNECVQDHLRHPIPAATEKLLAMYSGYNLKLSYSEVEALLTVNGGHILGLRAINAMLKETGSKYKVNFIPLETYEKDVSDLARFAMLAEYEPAIPVEYLPEAVLIFGGQKETEIVPKQANPDKNDYNATGDTLRVNELVKAAHVHRIINGQVVETQQDMDFIYLNAASVAFGDLNERITGNSEKGKTGMAQYWAADIGHTVDDIGYTDDTTPDPVSGTKIEDATTPGEELGHEMGEEAAKHNSPVQKETLEAIGMI